MAKNWIKGAIKNPGALREQMGVKEGETIPKAKLAATEKRLKKAAEGDKKLSPKNRKMLRRVVLAQTLRGMK
mgnify:CR=1 FL=1|jgi:phage tail sheath protein FI